MKRPSHYLQVLAEKIKKLETRFERVIERKNPPAAEAVGEEGQ